MANNNKYIIFDFDGTIADTIELALTIYNRIAIDYNSNPIKKDDLKLLRVSRPQDIFRAYKISHLKLVLILLRIRREMSRNISELRLVKDIKDSLIQIKNSGLCLGILTSNSKKNVTTFLRNHGLSEMIDFVYSGKSLFGKDKVMMQLFDHENISREDVIYIGDETRDIEASRKAGIKVIAVTWGLNDSETLSALQPDEIADSPKDLIACVRNLI